MPTKSSAAIARFHPFRDFLSQSLRSQNQEISQQAEMLLDALLKMIDKQQLVIELGKCLSPTKRQPKVSRTRKARVAS